MDNTIEKFISNPFNVEKVIREINAQFPIVVEQYIPNNPHRDATQYFRSGSCPVYAEILHDTFEGYAQYYDSASHVIVKIGNYYYDVGGIFSKEYLEKGDFVYCPDDYFGFVFTKFGRKDEEEKIIYEHLKEIAKDILQEKLQEYKEKTR